MTDVILKEDVEHLGTAGEVVEVKPGYARNYLLPQGLALRATEGNLNRIREEQRHEERAAERVKEKAVALSERLRGKSLTFNVRAGEDGSLYGSVKGEDLVERLAEDDLEIERSRIELEEPIKELGVYNVAVDLHEDVRPELKVWVVADE